MAVAAFGALLACASPRLPRPTYVQQPTEALQQVLYPPPPARVEFVPDEPKGGAVWIDGEWTWEGRRWAWKPGRWVVPPADAAYSPWTSVRDKTGLLYVAEGRWRDRQGRDLPDPAPAAVGKTRSGAVTDPDGDAVPATPNLPPQKTPEGPDSGGNDGGGPETPSGATPTGTEPKSGPTHDASDAGPDAAENDKRPPNSESSPKSSRALDAGSD